MQVDKSKLGQYLFIIGLILLAIFFASGEGWSMALGYFLTGLVLVFLGGFIFFRGRKPVDPNTARFRTVHKFRERKDKREKEQADRRKN
jgi:hypothetical protein